MKKFLIFLLSAFVLSLSTPLRAEDDLSTLRTMSEELSSDTIDIILNTGARYKTSGEDVAEYMYQFLSQNIPGDKYQKYNQTSIAPAGSPIYMSFYKTPYECNLAVRNCYIQIFGIKKLTKEPYEISRTYYDEAGEKRYVWMFDMTY